MKFKLLPSKKVTSYNEEPQPCDTQFAFVQKQGDEVQVLHTPVKCRDFLLDTLVWRATEAPCQGVYGWDYNYYCDELAIFNTKFEQNIAQVNEVEAILGINPTKLIETDVKGNFYLEHDPVWRKNTVMLSFYTLILRAFLTRNQSKDNVMQSLAYQGVKGSFDDLLDVVRKAKEESKVFLGIDGDKYTIHSTAGICSYFVKVKNA